MTPTEMKGSRFYAALFAATLLGACASEQLGPTPTIEPQPGHAFLKIVGDKNVFLENGNSRELIVKYVNDKDEGLAGSVSFKIEGDPKTSSISSTSSVTGPGGEVRIAVTGASSGEAAFRVVAEAQHATPVDWSVSVRGAAPPRPYKLEGTYRLESTFDMVSGLPGDAGEIIATIIDMTDSPTDPTSWLLGLDPGVRSAIPRAIDAFLNTFLKEVTTFTVDGQEISVVGKFMEFGNAFGDVAKRFGLLSKLEITKKPDGTYVAKHTIDGVFFRINNKRREQTLASLNMDNIVVENVPLMLTGESSVSIGDHNIPMSYGAMVVAAVDNVVIPIIAPRANSLSEMLTDLIDCYMVGEAIYEELEILDAGFYESLCETALVAGAEVLEGKLRELGGNASEFKIHGTVRPIDSNNDRTVDSLTGGEWEGFLMFGGERATLAKPNQKFSGQRMAN
jgi:hypothetical protein